MKRCKIIAEHLPSTQAQFAQLFRLLELKDSKPSVLLRRKRELTRVGIGDDVQKAMWLERGLATHSFDGTKRSRSRFNGRPDLGVRLPRPPQCQPMAR